MQKYTEISENTAVEDSRELLLINDKTIASHYSGPSFPTENLVVGMECYREDEEIKYRLVSLNPVRWVQVGELNGKPTAPTPDDTNGKYIANVEYVKNKIAELVDSSPEALNTLNELAEALGNDPNFATTMTNALAGKAALSHTHTKAQVGLANVDNTRDADKVVKSATKLQTARTINGVAFDGSANITVTAAANGGIANGINTLGKKAAADLPGTYPVGMSTHQVYNNGYPCAYGNVLTIKGLGTGATQFCMEWSGGDPPGTGNVWFRNARDNINKWSGWRQLAGGGAGAAATADNANKLGGLALSGTINNVANQVVRTDGSGYIQTGWISTISGAVGSINKIYCSNDNYIRYMSVANFKTALGINNVNNTADGNKTVAASGWLNLNNKLTYGASGLNYFNISGTAGNTANANMTPVAGWHHIIRMNHANAAGYYADLAIPLDGYKSGMFYRVISNGNPLGWYKLCDSNNMTQFTSGSALGVRNAGNAGGTIMKFHWSGQGGQPPWLWGGSDGTNMYVYNPSNFKVASAAACTGNAATATKLQTARTINGVAFDGTKNITINAGGLSPTSNVTVTASTQSALNPSGNISLGQIRVLNQATGVTAGTYTLQNLLQQLVNRSHVHNFSTINCNCDCNCGDDGE